MQQEDFRDIALIANGLWGESHRSVAASQETAAAVCLLDLPEDRTLERVSLAMLDRARREGASANPTLLNNPFYRLHAEERLILTALHFSRWSYARLARILGDTPEAIEMTAWQARLLLASTNPQRSGKPLFFPAGLNRGPHCPDYNLRAPWTQRFLDEELDPQRRIFLQSHLANCPGCRQSLNLGREVYYTAESMLPHLRGSASVEETLAATRRGFRRIRARRVGDDFTLWQSLVIFFGREDIRRTAVIAGAALILLKLFT